MAVKKDLNAESRRGNLCFIIFHFYSFLLCGSLRVLPFAFLCGKKLLAVKKDLNAESRGIRKDITF
jgi:hypothetical protein